MTHMSCNYKNACFFHIGADHKMEAEKSEAGGRAQVPLEYEFQGDGKYPKRGLITSL